MIEKIRMLEQRSQIIRKIRQFFFDRDFIEVETPLLSTDTIVDRYINPITADVEYPGGSTKRYLQTSPEFAMKRLLCEGATAIFQICKAFRNGELGPQHSPEFTMLEWYRVGDTYEKGRGLVDEFAQSILGTPAAVQLSFRDVFLKYADFDPFRISTEELREQASDVCQLDADEDRDGCLNAIMSALIEPGLQQIESAIIFDWPSSQSALAKVRQETASGSEATVEVAERFELYIRGTEIANGYHELTDAEELMNRNRTNNQLRESDGNSQLPTSSKLYSAMQRGMPNSCGTALGLDRLLMLLINKSEINDVVSFGFDDDCPTLT